MIPPSDKDAISANEHCGFSQRRISTSPYEQKSDEGLANQNTKTHGCDAPCDTIEEGACQQFHDTTENPNTKTHGCDTPCDTIEEGARQQFHDMSEVQNGFWLSEKPYFHFIMSKTHRKSLYRMVLPAKIHHVLPEQVVPVVLTFQNKNWEMSYLGDRFVKRFDNRWKNFLVDNDIKVGDGVILELLEYSEALIKFRAQILSGDIPRELLDKVDGKTPNNPIVIE